MRERLYIHYCPIPIQVKAWGGKYYLSARPVLSKYWSDKVPQYFHVNQSHLAYFSPTWFAQKVDASLAGSMHGWDVVDMTKERKN